MKRVLACQKFSKPERQRLLASFEIFLFDMSRQRAIGR